MSTLTVVRHGQARPFETDSDRLSETGELQARALKEYWARSGITFDEVWSGALERQRRTAAIAIARPAEVSSDWNEYDTEGVRHKLIPALATREEMDAFEREGPGPERNRRFQKMFEVAMLTWLEGSTIADRIEPWPAFRDRVRQGLRRIQEGPANRRVVLFTSGGPIGVLVQTALAAPERSFLEVNWRLRNCSLTEFVFSRDRLSLDSFNAIPHLEDPNLRTFR
jgi:broad specificity phosphatase PhoE